MSHQVFTREHAHNGVCVISHYEVTKSHSSEQNVRPEEGMSDHDHISMKIMKNSGFVEWVLLTCHTFSHVN